MNAPTLKLFLLLLFASFCSFALTIEGVVVDGKKNWNITFAKVHLLDTLMAEKCGTPTDADGKFRFVNVVPGVYHIRVSAFGYQDTTFSSIEIISDTTLALNIYRYCKYDDSKKDKTCPLCHKSDQVIPVQYGEPEAEQKGKKKKASATNDDFYPGGVATQCDPNWYCKRNKLKF